MHDLRPSWGGGRSGGGGYDLRSMIHGTIHGPMDYHGQGIARRRVVNCACNMHCTSYKHLKKMLIKRHGFGECSL